MYLKQLAAKPYMHLWIKKKPKRKGHRKEKWEKKRTGIGHEGSTVILFFHLSPLPADVFPTARLELQSSIWYLRLAPTLVG